LFATGACTRFSYEANKANKVVTYFKKLGPIYSEDMWLGKIGPNICSIDERKLSPVENIGHTVECDLTKCYDTFSDKGKRADIFFKDAAFSTKLDAKMQKYIAASPRKVCGVEYLVFHKDLPQDQYLKIFQVLQKHRCGMEIVAQKKVNLPPVPRLKDQKSDPLAEAKKVAIKNRGVFEKKWFQSAAAKCKFFDKFQQDTVMDRKLDAKEKMQGAFLNPARFADLDSCSGDSGQIISTLRAYVYGYDDKGQTLYSKSVSFTDNEKNADIKIKPDQRNWNALLNEIWAGSKGYQYLSLKK
jgi:hypothetical protein